MLQTYIFDTQAGQDFYKRLDDLHDEYVYHLLLSGLAEKGLDLESIKMTKNPDVSEKYCKRVVGGLVNVKPQIIVKLTEDKQPRLECIFTVLNDNEYVRNELFMIQNVMDWPQLGKYSCQIWYLGETALEEVRKKWE